jgi:hypothetical protein
MRKIFGLETPQTQSRDSVLRTGVLPKSGERGAWLHPIVLGNVQSLCL